jgi:hypothetical protein
MAQPIRHPGLAMPSWTLILTAAAALIALPFVVGLSLPATRTGQAQRLLPAPPETVRALILDVEAQPIWRADIARVDRDAEGWVETHRSGESVRFRLEGTSPALRLSFISSRGYQGTWPGLLEAEGSGTRLSVTEAATVPGPLSRLLARLVFDPEAFADRYLDELEAALIR